MGHRTAAHLASSEFPKVLLELGKSQPGNLPALKSHGALGGLYRACKRRSTPPQASLVVEKDPGTCGAPETSGLVQH